MDSGSVPQPRRRTKPTVVVVLGVFLGVFIFGCLSFRGCAESNFELAPESRLPIWMEVPPGTPREDLALKLFYYATSSDADENTVLVSTIAGKTRKFTAQHWWHPRTQRQLDIFYATEPRPEYPYPSYVVVNVAGQIDVIEHRKHREQNRDPSRALFWMTTDAAILREAREKAQPDE